jgi:trypsin
MVRLSLALLLLAVAASQAKTRRTMLPPALANNRKFLFTPDEKIVGGEVVEVGSIPFQVSFQDFNFGPFHFCGGSIFNQNFVITAAHCVAGEDFNNPQNLYVVVGEHELYNEEGIEQTIAVKRIISHVDYSPYVNDIALLELADPIKFSKKVGPAVLPTQGAQSSGNCTVSGWGTTSSGGFSSDLLQVVTVPFVSDAVCEKAYPGSIIESMICAGEEGKDSCQGDSGGPMVCNGFLAGIVSWGRGCALADFPGVYTEVSYFVEWITTNAQLSEMGQ